MTQCLKTFKKCLILNFCAKNRWNWIFNAKIQRIKKRLDIVWKSPKMSDLNILFWHFPPIFVSSNLTSCNIIWPHKIGYLWLFFWLTVVHSKCKRSSLRSQCWMRHSLWFSNTVWRRRSEVIFPLYFSYFSKDKRDDQNKEIKEAAKRKSVEFPTAFWEIKI